MMTTTEGFLDNYDCFSYLCKYYLSSTPYVMWTVCVEHVLVNLVNTLDLSWATVRHIV